MAKYSNKSNRCHREKNTSRGNKGTFISCKTTTTRGRPREGVIYRLTGGSDTASIARGDTWEESAMKPRQMGLFARRLSGADPELTDLADELGEAHGYPRTTVFPSAGAKGGYVTTFEVPRGFPAAPRGAQTKIRNALKKAGWEVKADMPREIWGANRADFFSVVVVPSATGRKAAKKEFKFYRQGPGVYAAKRARLRIARDDNYPIGHQWTLLHRRQGKWHPVGNYRTKAEAEKAGHAHGGGSRARARPIHPKNLVWRDSENEVREIVDRHGYLYEARFIDDYSGRGMFGRTASFAVVIHPDEYEDVGPRSEMGQELVAQGLKFDRMGRRGWVYYT